MKTKRKTNNWIWIGFLVVLALLMLLAFSGDNGDLLLSLFRDDHTTEELQEKLRDFGPRGYIAMSLLAMLQVVCSVLPAEPVQMLAGITFGFGGGLLLCIIGVALGNTVIYLLQKTFGDKLRRFFIKSLHLDLEAIAQSSQCTFIILLLYFLPAIPYGMICFFAASVGMRYRRLIVVTLVGALPSVCIGVGLGHMFISAGWVVSVCVFSVFVLLCVLVIWKKNVLFSKINALAERPGYSSKTKVQKGSRVLLLLLNIVLRPYFRLRGIRVRATNKLGKQPEAPSIILCNHGSFLDFLYVDILLRKSHPHFVVARLYFYHKLLGKLLKKLGCFPKSMFALDIESTKNCLAVLKNGEMLAMMPEARLSTVGRFEDIQDTTYSFLKKAQVPIYTVKIHGDYFADPKWGKGFRRGSVVEAELDILFTAQQVRESTVEQLRQGVEQRLYYDEFQWLSTRPKLKYRSRRMAEGLENILTLCPKCGGKHTLTTKGKDVFCQNCGKLTSVDDRYGFDTGFRFQNFAQWYDWQKEVMAQQMADDPDFRLHSKVELRLPGNGDSLTRSAGQGECTLDRGGLTYIGTRDDEEVTIHFPMSRIYRLLFGAGEDFEIYDGSEILYFVPEERRSAVDWYVASMLLSDEARNQP